MTKRTIVVVGGGHAGIHAVKEIKKRVNSCRIVLLDPQPAHIRKVIVFKAITGGSEMQVPWSAVLPVGTEFKRGAVQRVHPVKNRIEYVDESGLTHELSYDVLVIAVGSVVRKVSGSGHTLAGLENAYEIRKKIEENVEKARYISEVAERKRLLTVSVVGGGISGIETAFELNHFIKEKANSNGLDQKEVRVNLIHSEQELLGEESERVQKRIKEKCHQKGIHIHYGVRALKEESGLLHLNNGDKILTGVTVWSIGLVPNPVVQRLGLPVESGRLLTDFSYRVQGFSTIYSIGDCAKITDPVSGLVDGMTCKEGINQAKILGRVIASDLKGKQAPTHKPIRQTLCFSLGPGDALIWAKIAGIELMLDRVIAWRVRKMTWNMASMIR